MLVVEEVAESKDEKKREPKKLENRNLQYALRFALLLLRIWP
jgi:hypothetical protein